MQCVFTGGVCTCRIGTLQFNKFEETLVSAGLEVTPVMEMIMVLLWSVCAST